MPYTGLYLLIFVIIHLFTFHFVDKTHQTIYHIVAGVFNRPVYAAFYIFSMIVVAFHVKHGFWSAFQSLGANHYTNGQITGRLVAELKAGREFAPSLLFNAFENVAFTRFSGIKVSRDHIVKIGATDVHLAGSGPALFTLIKDRTQAEDLYTRCQQQGMETYLTETLASIEEAGRRA